MDGLDFLIDQQYPQIEAREWMKECTFVQVTNDNITQCIDHCLDAPNGYYALDLETTGLDNRVFNGRTVDQMVGVCLCPDGVTGYYIPLRHKEGVEHNVTWSVFEKEFQRLMAATVAKKVRAIFHGGIFDQVFLTYWGGVAFGDWDKPSTWEDTEILAYLENPRRRDKRLKSLTDKELGFDQIHLAELFPEGHKGDMDFSTLDPARVEVTWYGGGDGIFTYRLFEKFHPLVMTPAGGHSQKRIYLIEKSCVASIRWMHRNRIYRDKEKVLELLQLGQQEWFESVFDLYSAVGEALGRDVMPGYYKMLRDRFDANDPDNLLNEQIQRAKNQYQRKYPDPKQPIDKLGKAWPPIYDVASPKQLGQMFWELGVPGLVFTEKSGQVKTSKDVLDLIVERAAKKFPYMGKVKRFREVHKALTNYLFPMLEWADETDGTMRVNFRAHKVDTGRFATPAKARVQLPGWPQMNLQSLPATYNPDRPECMRRLRECIAARPPKKPGSPRRYIVAIDFSGVELRLVTNLSREPKWLTEFFRCSTCSRSFDRGDGTKTPKAPPCRCPNCGSDKIGDLHSLTALSVYGDDATEKPEWKHLRQNAKATNFALCYGGGGNAVIRATGCGKNEGWRIKRQFDETYKTLSGWWKVQWAFARKHEYVLTAFGRKYPVPDINHEDGGFRSKAERNSVNGPIQGSSADITKIAMALVYKECKKRGWAEEKVLMIITMHDELVFDICGSVLEEAIEVIKPIMGANPFILAKKWPVPLVSDVEIGDSWDVPWDLNSMRAGEVKFNGNKKFKKPEKAEAAGLVWDAMSKFPADLAPYFKMHTFEEVDAFLEDPSKMPGAKPAVAVVESAPQEEVVGGPLYPHLTTIPSMEVVQPDHIDEIIPHDSPELDVYREDLPRVAPPFEEGPIARLASEAVANQMPAGPPVGLAKGDVYVFEVGSPLRYETVDDLARVILACRGRGTRLLRIKLPDGTMLNDLEPWRELFGDDEVVVNENEFFYTARARGLC